MASKTIQIAVTDYAAKRGITRQAALKAVKKYYEGGVMPPYVSKIEKMNKFYVLTVTVDKKGELK